MGKAILPRHQFFINNRGVASVVPSPSHWVEGIVWALTAKDEQRLDRFEGVEDGFYTRAWLTVQQDDGQLLGALVYVASSTEVGKPRPGYLDRITENAIRRGFSDSYIAYLRSLS
jgi:gamma-glutamylcyclotransferase (GGCT)/AIG2-like uncharacterized protein YtfP